MPFCSILWNNFHISALTPSAITSRPTISSKSSNSLSVFLLASDSALADHCGRLQIIFTYILIFTYLLTIICYLFLYVFSLPT